MGKEEQERGKRKERERKERLCFRVLVILCGL